MKLNLVDMKFRKFVSIIVVVVIAVILLVRLLPQANINSNAEQTDHKIVDKETGISFTFPNCTIKPARVYSLSETDYTCDDTSSKIGYAVTAAKSNSDLATDDKSAYDYLESSYLSVAFPPEKYTIISKKHVIFAGFPAIDYSVISKSTSLYKYERGLVVVNHKQHVLVDLYYTSNQSIDESSYQGFIDTLKI